MKENVAFPVIVQTPVVLLVFSKLLTIETVFGFAI